MYTLCTSVSALDSLPRHANVKRSATALKRLQLKKQGRSRQQDQSGFSPKDDIKNMASRRSSRPSRGLASNDLPLASSDLYTVKQLEDRIAFSDAEISEDDIAGKKMMYLLTKNKTSSTSPDKSLRRNRAIQIKKSTPSSTEMHRSLMKRSVTSIPAKIRSVDKGIIGKPSQFQHTGRIGAASYNPLQSFDDIRFKEQLCEVAAALKLVDDEVFAPPSSGNYSGDPVRCRDSGINASRAIEADSKASEKIEPSDSTREASEIALKGNVKRSATKRKPVPLPRKLEVLYDEFKSAEVKSSAETMNASQTPAAVLLAFSGGKEKPLPSLRASDGKRLVSGPSGDYITDTANGRWINNLSEITKALKAQEVDEDEKEDVAEAFGKGGAVLGQVTAPY